MMGKIVITGGAGFIGSYLAENLVNEGHRPVIVDNLFQRSLSNLASIRKRIHFEEVDITNAQKLNKIFRRYRPTTVYHLAAHHFIPYCNQNPVEAVRVNALGTQMISKCCSEYNVKKVFYASTAAVYGISNKPHKESEPPNPTDIYGLTKLWGENIMKLLSEKSGTKVLVGRFFNAIGLKETNPHLLPDIFSQIRKSRSRNKIPLKLGNIFPKRDYIHAKDIADSAVRIMQSSRNKINYEVTNIGSGQEYSVKEIVERIQKIIEKKIVIKSDSSKKRRVDRKHLCADNSKLVRKFGMTFSYNLNSSLSELIADLP